MKNAKRQTVVLFHPLISVFPAIILALNLAGDLFADAPPALTTIRSVGTNAEGFTTYTLEWDAAPDILYRLQSRDSFDSNSTWETFDIAQPESSRGNFKVRGEKYEANADQVKRTKFFQVLMPQAEIFGVEPALISTNGGTSYLFGQCLGTNFTLRIGGLIIAPNTLQPGSIYSFDVAAGLLAEGTYDVEVLDGTNVIATASKLFSVTGQPTPVGESSQRLLEVPEEPPASPMTATLLMPALMKAKEKANRTKCSSNLRTLPSGEVQMTEVDVEIPGRGLDFVWTRTYRSRTGLNTVMGQNWSHSYDIRAFVNAGGIVVVLDGTGRSDNYYRGPDGSYTANELFSEGTLSNGVFTLTFPDGGKWVFNSISNTIAPGRIERCEDRNGNAITFTYDSSDRLEEIIDTLGRTNRLAYDGLGHLGSLTDFSGRRWSYRYWLTSPNGPLQSVTTPPVVGTPNTNDFPAGKTTQYFYSSGSPDSQLNDNLIRIIDPNGQVSVELSYSKALDPLDVAYDRVLSLSRGPHPPTTFTYLRQTPAPSNHWAVMKIICNDPVGNLAIDWFDSLNRGIVHRDIAARAVPGTFVTEDKLPTDKLRITDPDFWETRFEWNVDSLCTRIVYPRSNSTEVVYQRAYNQNNARSNHAKRRSDGNPRVIRERACCGDVDGDGGGEDQVSYFTYDSRFGSDAKNAVLYEAYVKGMIGNSRTIGNSKTAKLPTFSRGYSTAKLSFGPRQTTSMDGSKVILDRDTGRSKGFGFVTWTSDPRGNEDTFQYDEHGNCVRIAHEGRLLNGDDKPVSTFEYNAFGQLTAIVNAADADGYQRRDEFEYYDKGEQTGYMRMFTVDTMGPTVQITSYEWDADGDLVSITDPRGNQTKFHNNTLNQRVREVSPPECLGCLGITTDFFYDANDNLVRMEHENRDAVGVLSTNNPTWTTLYQYDVLNRRTLLAHELTHVAQQRFATNKYVYDGNSNLLEEHSPEAVNGNQPANYVKFEYDTRNLPFITAHAPNSADSSTDIFDYDENGNLSREISGAGGGSGGVVTLYAYDGFDRCGKIIDPLGNQSSFAYDANDNIIYEARTGQTNDVPGSVGNVLLAEKYHSYDSINRRVDSWVSIFERVSQVPLLDGKASTQIAFAPNGQCRRVTDDNGRVTRYSYDTIGRVSVVTDPKTNTISYSYDLNDNVVTVTQSDTPDVPGSRQTFVTTAGYDALNRRVIDYDNVGNTNRYGYDSRGNLTRHQDAKVVVRGWDYDGKNRVTILEADLDGDGEFEPLVDSIITQEWDDNSRLISQHDANGNVTRYAYDNLDRPIATTNADNTVHSLIWSPRSNLILYGDANGTRTSFTYDDLDRCVRKDISFAPGSQVSTQTTFEIYRYDGMSDCVLASNNVSMLDFSYDSMGQIAKAKQDCIAMAMTFDGEGNRLTMTYPSGLVVSYTYDALNQVSSVAAPFVPGGAVVSLATFAYEGPGRLGRMSRNNGVNTRWTWNGLENPKNVAGDFGWQQVSLINHQVSSGGQTIDRRLAAYDRNQNKILRQQVLPFATGVPALTTNIMTYDPLNRMSSFARNRASSAYTKNFALDHNGNRQSVSSNGVTEVYTMDATLPEPADFQMNQYTGTPFGGREYDRNGNMVFIPGPVGGTQFTYDYANRLVNVSRSVGPAMVPIVSFTYDAFGRRISKTKYPDAPALPVTTQYLLDPDSDDDGVLEERVDGVARFFAVWPHMHKSAGHARISATGEILWVHTDELGSALAVTDAHTNVVERYDYDEYGAVRFLNAEGVPLVASDGSPATESQVGNDFLFRGMFWDGETGLYACSFAQKLGGVAKGIAQVGLGVVGQRTYFDPKTGRSLSPTGCNPQTGKNAFTFADDNPWSAKIKEGRKGLNAMNVKRALTGGDPIHGVDVKLGWGARSSGDPIHGVDVKLGLSARASGGDPIHGVDVKLGWGARGGSGGGGGCGGSISIDEPGVHFAGISIDEPGVHFAEISIDEPGVHFAGVSRRRVEVLKSNKNGDPDANRVMSPGRREGGYYALYSLQKGARTRLVGSRDIVIVVPGSSY